MKPVIPDLHTPDATLVIYGGGQEDGPLPLPASKSIDTTVSTEWELSDEEREILAAGGRIQLVIWTFGLPPQPVLLQVKKQ
jgi:hypothetical protein